jgi:signal transduction histidine kinase
MRRGASEWLVLPLFLLPVIAGAGFAFLARGAFLAETSRYGRDGERIAREWLAEEPAAGERLRRWFADRIAPESAGVPFRLDGFAGILADEAPGEPWTFVRLWPAGLLPEALGDPEVRLSVEAGTPPSRAGPLDPGTEALARLLAGPDPAGLRTAPLPPALKLFLLRRWPPGEDDGPWRAEAARVIEAVRSLDRFADRPEALAPGRHRFGALEVLVPPDRRPARVGSARAGAAGPPFTVAESPDGLARLVWLDAPVPAPGAAWTGRLGEPLAGDYAFVLPHGDRWWEGPLVLRWGGPVAGLLLLSLVVPVALLVSLRRRRRLDAARARFINELAHDLRTPLTSLRLHADLLAAGRAPEGDRPRYDETIAREAGRLTALLENLLDLSRLERGAREFTIEDLDLETAVEGAIAGFAALHPARADDVRVAGPEGVRVRADGAALARCLANLLDNAGKFTPPGTPIRVEWDDGGEGAVRIVVRDHGPGIPQAERRRVFRRYERGAAAQRDGVPGSGLGLALVAELAAGMGGRARLLDTETGAAFEVALPGGRS